MDKNDFTELLNKIFEQNGLSDLLNEEKSEKFYKLSSILIETNKLFNLTAITDEKGIILKHFADSVTIARLIPEHSTLIDVGCGAGFPSLPIAIIRNDVKITSLDSTAKKINFINSTAKELELDNIVAITARAEDFAKANREKFDVSTSRAVARLNILDELCLPLTKKDGLFIAMKSSRGEEEYNEAKNGISKLGANLLQISSITLNNDDESLDREIYVFKKCSATPVQYPRNYSQICKKPL